MNLAFRALLVLAGVTAGAACFAANAWFWWHWFAASPESQKLMVAVSASAGVLKLAIPGHLAAARKPWRSEPALAALFAVVVVFEVCSGIGFAATSRGEASGGAKAHNARLVELRNELKRADALAAAIPAYDPTRTPGGIESELETAKRATKGCTERWEIRKDRCELVAKLETELSAARKRSQILADRDAAAGRLRAHGPERTEDAQAATLGRLFRAIPGLGDTTDDGAKLLVHALLALIFELVPAAIAAGVRPQAPMPEPPRGRERDPEPSFTNGPSPPADVDRRDVESMLAAAASGAVSLLTVSPDGAWLRFRQTALARELGVSKATISNHLKRAATAGRLQYRSDHNGTAVLLGSTRKPVLAVA